MFPLGGHGITLMTSTTSKRVAVQNRRGLIVLMCLDRQFVDVAFALEFVFQE